ncbi:hypothetical protein GCM10023165_01330 [Variovorax defluvii]|uniref:Uncharacterized protein n=1 Tax=Variovorax defluvii TaxID=913761 RepID=A0ABP8GRS5_9BURK
MTSETNCAANCAALADEIKLPYSRARKGAGLVLAVVTLWTGAVLAQPTKPPAPPSQQAPQAGTDAGIVTKPPMGLDPELTTRPPRKIDPEMLERPPAQARPGDSAEEKRGAAPSRRSREDDCRGSAADCKQNSAR